MSALAASWRRSLTKYCLHPAQRQNQERLDSHVFNRERDKNSLLLKAAESPLDGLYKLVGSSGCGVFLTDAEGTVLETRYATSDATMFEHCNLSTGANWSEATEGTNGIGTCLVEQRPVIIHRDQHFFACHTAMSCIDAPIFDSSGRLAGALDVSTARLDHDARMNDLLCASVAQTAKQIETELFRTAFAKNRILLPETPGNETSALYAVDEDDLVVGATRAARRLANLPQEGDFDPIPYGDLFHPHSNETSLRGFERGEKAAIKRALSRTNGNVSKAARQLGIGRATLYRRIGKLGLSTA
ncbi:MAG: GAF domain-containing protein [Pseudomonadota bacterium]